MHGEIARRWKVEELASDVGMSRTSFSERFRALVGMPPMEYLIRWRMTAAIIARHRVGMFRDMGQVPTDALATKLLETSTVALGVLLRGRSYIGWLAIAESDRVLAGAGANVQSQLPRISHSGIAVTTAPVPLVVSVYTEPDFRGMGIARANEYTAEVDDRAGLRSRGPSCLRRRPAVIPITWLCPYERDALVTNGQWATRMKPD